MLRTLHCLDSRLTDGGKVVSPTNRPHFTPQKHYFSVSGTHFCLRLRKPQGLLQLEGLGKLNKFNDLEGTRTRGLLACSIVPQPTMLLHAPIWKFWKTEHWYSMILIHELRSWMFEKNKADVLCPLQKSTDLFIKTGADQCHSNCMLLP
jgi:hypothetical protein